MCESTESYGVELWKNLYKNPNYGLDLFGLLQCLLGSLFDGAEKVRGIFEQENATGKNSACEGFG
ncbi:hypothetical protein VCRA2110O135_190081 [Vibrio crassostreae]|nr:hypothetical protein VCRA2110O135_190081 [Vibrio crassostreae]